MTIQKYSIEEALDRLYRVWKNAKPTDDSPFSLKGEKLSWNEALSRLAELMQGSIPGEVLTLPVDALVTTGSFTVAHDSLHANGIGSQKLGNSVSHILIDDDGNLTLVGDATSYTDISVSATRLRQGALSKPDFDYDEIGLLFPQDDTAEKIYLNVQFLHQKKLGTAISPHVHYIQSEENQPTFEYYYRWYNNGDEVPSAWQTGTTSANKGIFSYTTGTSIMNIGGFPDVAAIEDESVSSNFDIILWRNDNDVTGDVLVKYVDIHYEIDGFGSDEEYTK